VLKNSKRLLAKRSFRPVLVSSQSDEQLAKKVTVAEVKSVVKKKRAPFTPAATTESEFTTKISGSYVANHINNMERAVQGEYQMGELEMSRTRSLIYWMNKNHPRGYRFRTMREGDLLLVWRIK